MAQKVGNGGHGLEDYSENTGRYISDGEPNKYYKNPTERRGFYDIKVEDIVPKKTFSGEERKFHSTAKWSNTEKRRFERNLEEQDRAVYGEDFINRAIDKNVPDTLENESTERRIQRRKWVEDEIIAQENARTIKHEHHATIVLGLPGSGKSTIANPILENTGAFEIDSDIFKTNYIPEFREDPTKSVATQHEAAWLANRMKKKIVVSGANLMIGKVGGNYKQIKYIIKYLKSKGYTIDVVYNDLPLSETLKRNDNRFKSAQEKGGVGRYVPRTYVYESAEGVPKTINSLIRHNRDIDGLTIYSNDVAMGEKPKLLKRIGNPREVKI